MAKIIVDGKVYATKKEAIRFFNDAINNTEGSEQSRMYFARNSIENGNNHIDTYRDIAEKFDSKQLTDFLKKKAKYGK